MPKSQVIMESKPVAEFVGKHAFLSNFYACRIVYEGMAYGSSEHAYQAAKSISPSVRATVRDIPTPGKAKRFGQTIELRPQWEKIKVGIMQDILLLKFRREALRNLLLATGDAELVEGNVWGDTYWGRDVLKGGENKLGQLLMEIRADFRAGK